MKVITLYVAIFLCLAGFAQPNPRLKTMQKMIAQKTVADSANPAAINSTCCPPWDTGRLRQSMVYKGTGGIGDPYTLVWRPSNTMLLQIQAYLNYMRLLRPCINSLAMEFRLHDQGTGSLPSTNGWGPQTGNIWVGFTANSTGAVSMANPIPVAFYPFTNTMQLDRWYAINCGIYHNSCGESMFSKDCAERTIYVRVQAMSLKGGNNAGSPKLQISDGNEILN